MHPHLVKKKKYISRFEFPDKRVGCLTGESLTTSTNLVGEWDGGPSRRWRHRHLCENLMQKEKSFST